MTRDENGSPKSTSTPKRLPNKLIQFWSQAHHSGSTVSFNHSVQSNSSKSNRSMVSSNDSNASFDCSPGFVKSLANDESTNMILNDTNLSVDSNGSRTTGSRLDVIPSPLQRQCSPGSDVLFTTPRSSPKGQVTARPRPLFIHSPTTNPSTATTRTSSGQSKCHSVPILSDVSSGHTSPNLSHLIKAWNSPHTSGATVSFNKGSSVASGEASASINDSRQTLQGRVLFESSLAESTDLSRDQSQTTDSFDNGETIDSFDHSRTTDNHDHSSSMDSLKRSHGTDMSGNSRTSACNELSRSSSSHKRDVSLASSSSSSSSSSRLLQSSQHTHASSTIEHSTSVGSSKLSRSSSDGETSASVERSTSSRDSGCASKLCRSASSTEHSCSLRSSEFSRTSISDGLGQSADSTRNSNSFDSSENNHSGDSSTTKTRISHTSENSTVDTPDSRSSYGRIHVSQVDGETSTLKENDTSGSYASMRSTKSREKRTMSNSDHSPSPNTSGIASILDPSVMIANTAQSPSGREDGSQSSLERHRSSATFDATCTSVDDMDESTRIHRLQSKKIQCSTSTSVNDDIEMDLSSFAKAQLSFLPGGGTTTAPQPILQPKQNPNEGLSVNVRSSVPIASTLKGPETRGTPERSVVRSESSYTSKNLPVASPLVGSDDSAPNLLLSKSLNRPKHVTFPDEVIVDLNDLATSVCDSNRSADSSSDPSRYENSSLMMSNSILGSESSRNMDSALETSTRSTSSKLTSQSIDIVDSPKPTVSTRGILKNSTYESPFSGESPFNDSKSSTDDINESEHTVNSLSVHLSGEALPNRRGCVAASITDQCSVNENVELRYLNPVSADADAMLTPCGNAETSVDSTYFTPQPSLVTALIERSECSMEAGQVSFDALNLPFSPETIPSPDDLDLTSIHSEGSDGALTGNRHHLVCLGSENDHKLDSSALFAVACDEDGARHESFSFDVGCNKECNRSNDTERMLANVINAAQQAVSNEQTLSSTEQVSKPTKIRNIYPALVAPHAIMADLNGLYVQATTDTSDNHALLQQHIDGNSKPRGPNQVEHADKVSADRVPSRKSDFNQVSSNQPRPRTLENDEINESFELSSVSTLDSDKEEGQMHFWIDAFLDLVTPTEDERTVNSDDSSSTVSESVAFTHTGNNVSEDISNFTRNIPDTRIFPDSNKKITRNKSKKKIVSSFSRLREWWKKELIAEVMRDSANKAEIEKKSKKLRVSCPNVEKLVSKEFKKVLSGERIELIGSIDSCDADVAASNPRQHDPRDTLPPDWMESLKKTIVCGTADGFKESYKTIQHEVESFDTLDGLVQALKNSKFETDSAAISGRFKSMYDKIQKGMMETNIFEKATATSQPVVDATSPDCNADERGATANILMHNLSPIESTGMPENGFLNAPPDDSLELFMNEGRSPVRTPQKSFTAKSHIGLVPFEHRKHSSGRRIFETPENSLIECSMNESRFSNVEAEAADVTTYSVTSPRVTNEEMTQAEGTHRSPLDGWTLPSENEISMSEFEQRKLCSTSSEASFVSRTDNCMPHQTCRTESSPDVSIEVSSLPPSPDYRVSFNGKKEFKPSPDKRNITRDTVPDISEESVSLTKLDFIQVSRVRESHPVTEIAPVCEQSLSRTKRRRSPKIHVTTLSQPNIGREEPCVPSDPFLTHDATPPSVGDTSQQADISEANLTQFGEECELPARLSRGSDDDESYEAQDSRILPGASFTCLDEEFAQAASATETNQTRMTPEGLSVQEATPAQTSATPFNDDGQSNPSKVQLLRRIRSIPLLQKRLGMKSRRKTAPHAESLYTKPKSNLLRVHVSEDEVVTARPDPVADHQLLNLRKSTNSISELNQATWPVDAESSSKLTVSSLIHNVEVPCLNAFLSDQKEELAFNRGLVRRQSDGSRQLAPSFVPNQSLRAPDRGMFIAFHESLSVSQQDGTRQEEKTCSPNSSFHEWEDFSSNQFGFNSFAFEKARGVLSEPIVASSQDFAVEKQVAPQASDVYTTSESDFVSFDKSV